MDLRQFKFANDEEIICEVVEWHDEEHDTMVVRKTLKIISVEDIEEGLRYYTFKPWISMNNDPEMLHIVNPYHIVAESIPSKSAEKAYFDIINEMKEFHEEEIELNIGNELIDDSDSETNVVQFSKKILH